MGGVVAGELSWAALVYGGLWGRQELQTQGFAGEHIQVHSSGLSTGAEQAAAPVLG